MSDDDPRADVYTVAAWLSELDRVLHPLLRTPRGRVRLAPSFPPALPPLGNPFAPPGGVGPAGAPPRRASSALQSASVREAPATRANAEAPGPRLTPTATSAGLRAAPAAPPSPQAKPQPQLPAPRTARTHEPRWITPASEVAAATNEASAPGIAQRQQPTAMGEAADTARGDTAREARPIPPPAQRIPTVRAPSPPTASAPHPRPSERRLALELGEESRSESLRLRYAKPELPLDIHPTPASTGPKVDTQARPIPAIVVPPALPAFPAFVAAGAPHNEFAPEPGTGTRRALDADADGQRASSPSAARRADASRDADRPRPLASAEVSFDLEDMDFVMPADAPTRAPPSQHLMRRAADLSLTHAEQRRLQNKLGAAFLDRALLRNR